MPEWLQVIAFIAIPAVALVGLFYYVRATIEQAEAMQKPCVVLRSTLRDPQEAVLEISGIRGDLIIRAIGGLVALHNIGTGPAVNVSYVFERVDQPEDTPFRSGGTIQTLAPNQDLPTHVSRTLFPAHHFQCTIIYESLSRHIYQTRTSANNDVLGEFTFKRMSFWARMMHSKRER